MRNGKILSPIAFRSEPLFGSPKDLFVEKKELMNWIQPVRWDPSFKRNTNCEICLTNTTNVPGYDVYCQYCNVVVHRVCLKRNVDTKNWVCFYCLDYNQNSKEIYQQMSNEIALEKSQYQAQVMIAKIWRGYRERKRYNLVYKVVLKIQIFFRLHRRKIIFQLSRQLKLRPLKVTVFQANGLAVGDERTGECDSYIIATIVDEEKIPHHQVWRTETVVIRGTRSPIFNSDLIFGGVSGIHVLVLTFFHKGSPRDTCLGQACLKLRANQLWRTGGRFILTLTEREYLIREFNGLEINANYFAVSPSGTVEVQLHTYFGMEVECGSLFGTSLDDLSRIIRKLPFNKALVSTYISVRSSTVHAVSASGGGDPNQGGQGVQGGGHAQGGTGTQAPAAAAGNGNGGGNRSILTNLNIYSALPLKRMWIAVFDGMVYFYHRMGDLCRLAMKLSSFELAFEKSRGCSIVLSRSMLPQVRLSPSCPADLLKWEIVFLSAYRDAGGKGGKRKPAELARLTRNLKELNSSSSSPHLGKSHKLENLNHQSSPKSKNKISSSSSSSFSSSLLPFLPKINEKKNMEGRKVVAGEDEESEGGASEEEGELHPRGMRGRTRTKNRISLLAKNLLGEEEEEDEQEGIEEKEEKEEKEKDNGVIREGNGGYNNVQEVDLNKKKRLKMPISIQKKEKEEERGEWKPQITEKSQGRGNERERIHRVTPFSSTSSSSSTTTTTSSSTATTTTTFFSSSSSTSSFLPPIHSSSKESLPTNIHENERKNAGGGRGGGGGGGGKKKKIDKEREIEREKERKKIERKRERMNILRGIHEEEGGGEGEDGGGGGGGGGIHSEVGLNEGLEKMVGILQLNITLKQREKHKEQARLYYNID